MYDHNDYAKCYGKYVWCLHCERVYEKKDWLKNKFHCPNQECDGSPIDVIDWKSVLQNNPNNPKIPEIGKYYSSFRD